jgi:hypothetical protein
MSEFCGPDFVVVLGTRSDMRIIPFSEILPHSFTKENLEPTENLQSGTILTPHGEEPQVFTFDEEYGEDLDPDEFFDDEDLDEEDFDEEDLDEEDLDDEDLDGEVIDEEHEDEGLNEAEEQGDEGVFLDLTPKSQSEPKIFEFDDAENLHELEDRWEI